MRACWALVLVGCGFQDGGAPNDTSVGSSHHDAPGPHSEAVAGIQPPRLQDEQSSSGTGGTVSAMLSGSVSDGDIELVLVTWQGGGTMLVSVSDARGSGYMTLVQPAVGSLECQLAWERVDKVISPNTVTATFSGPVNNRIAVAEYTNVPAAGLPVFDGSAATAISGSASIMASITTAQANDMLVALLGTGATPAAGSGFTEELVTSTSLIEQEVAASPGSHTASASFNSSNASCLGLVAALGLE